MRSGRIFIFTALHHEARPFIESFSLKKNGDDRIFPVYEGEKVILTVTGTGKTSCSCAVSHTLTKYNVCDADILVNAGICAGNGQGRYLINSILDRDTGRYFYPDMIRSIPLEEKGLKTASSVVDASEIGSSKMLFDMEGSAFFEAASYYAAPHNILMLKAVSDDGARNGIANVSKERICELIAPFTATVSELIKETECDDNEKVSPDLSLLTQQLKCSEYMRNELEKIDRFCRAEGIDMMSLITRDLPVDSRKEGREVIDEILSRLS